MVSSPSTNIVVDTGPDFRQQMLRIGIDHLEAVLLTHEHNDHIVGIDDVRPFNFRSGNDMPVYGLGRVLDELKDRFDYIFSIDHYPGRPRLKTIVTEAFESLSVGDIDILSLDILHGDLPILGYRFGDFTYITDAKTIPPSTLEAISGTKTLVLNTLHHREHHSHLNLMQALDIIEIIKPEQAYFTHLSHEMGLYDEVQSNLPENVFIAYDGLIIDG